MILNDKEKEKIAKFNRSYAVIEYGLSGQPYLKRNLIQNLEWNCSGKFFANGFQREKAQLDIENKFIYKIWKYFQFKAIMKAAYDPVISTGLQYRSELLMGVFYEN